MSKHEAAGLSAAPAAQSGSWVATGQPAAICNRNDVAGQRLLDIYRRWFEVVPANTPTLLTEAYRLRYQVYCVENAFEDPNDNPGELETDHFDARSVHSLLIHRPSGAAAGTVRVVLPDTEHSRQSFAIQQVCDDPLLDDPVRFPVATMGEISRFSISKLFRRRQGDTLYGITDGPRLTPAEERRIAPHMTLGLMEALMRMSVENRLSHLCAAMEPKLLRLLGRLGIHFHPIGSLVNFHGWRQPCMIEIEPFLERLRQEREEVWEVITDDGRNWDVYCRNVASSG